MAIATPTLRVTLELWITLTTHLAHSATIKGQISDIFSVSDIISYVKPYIKSMQLGPETIIYERSKPASSPEIAIEEMIKELQPYLQDSDAGENLELEGDDETTIIEFTPRAHNAITNGTKDNVTEESFQVNLRKYKKMRNNIKLALERESVSNKTKHIVTTTLDELIAILVQRQCPQGIFQNSNLKKQFRFRTSFLENFMPNITYDSHNHCYINGVKFGGNECKILKAPSNNCQLYGKKLSEEECKKLVQFAMSDKPCYIGKKKFSAEVCKKLAKNITDAINMTSNAFKEYIKTILPTTDIQMLNFYNSFTKTLSNVLRDSHKIPANYKVKCMLVNIDKERIKNSLRNNDACLDFRLCSEELREFLKVFYKSLNDTTVRAFRNYAAMYEKDIITDESDEKNAVIATINHGGDVAVERVANAFIKTTSEITLDVNKDRDMNIAALREYVKHTVKTVNNTICKHLEGDISSLRVRLLLAVKEDLAHNIRSDLEQFESDVIKQICSFFITCKGTLPKLSHSQYLSRKFVPRAKSKRNSVFVKLKLAMDDDLKSTLMENHKAMLKDLSSVKVAEMRTRDKNISNVVVTRTTIKSDEAKPTTMLNRHRSTQNSDSDEHDDEIASNILKANK